MSNNPEFITQLAKETILLESESIANLTTLLDTDFYNAVDLIQFHQHLFV